MWTNTEAVVQRCSVKKVFIKHLWWLLMQIPGVHLLVKLQTGGTNEWTTKMKSLTGISEGYDKCTKATVQNNYFCRTPPDDCFCFETWSRYHYNKKRQKFKIILIQRSSRKMNRNKNLLILYYLWKISTFSTLFHSKL